MENSQILNANASEEISRISILPSVILMLSVDRCTQYILFSLAKLVEMVVYRPQNCTKYLTW